MPPSPTSSVAHRHLMLLEMELEDALAAEAAARREIRLLLEEYEKQGNEFKGEYMPPFAGRYPRSLL